MIKRTPSRNSRSRGFKVRHILQICLLLGVCFWLIYQVKHSHATKEEFDKKEAKISVRTQNGNGDVNLGRKGLHPHVQDQKHEEDDEEEALAEEDESKHELKQLQDDNKHEGGEPEKDVTTSEEDGGEEESKNEEDEREDVNNHDEEDREDENKHEGGKKEEGNELEEEARDDGNKHEEEVRDEGNNREEEDREEGNRLEEEEREEGNKHEEENRGEGNKHDDEEREEETKSDETEEDGRGVGDDEIDEHEQQKIEVEADHEEDLVDEEKERGEIVEKESGNEEGETDKEGQVDDEVSAEDRDHGGGTQNREAREKHYRADDASSAVTHDTQVVNNEREDTSADNSNRNTVTNNLESENAIDSINGQQNNSTSELGVVRTDEENGGKGTKSEEQLLKSAANEQQLPRDKPVGDINKEAEKNLTSGSTEVSGTSEQKEISVMSDSKKPQNETVATTDVEALNLKTAELQLNSTSTVSDKTKNTKTVVKDFNSTSYSELGRSNNTIKPEVSIEEEVNSALSTATGTKETEDTARHENSDTENESGGTGEDSGLSTTDGTGDAVPDPDPIDTSDTSIIQDEKEARIDLDTLPENIAEGINSRDAAAE